MGFYVDKVPACGPTAVDELRALKARLAAEPFVLKATASSEPTERQLEWMRQHIPHFATAERQAKAARERRA